MSSVRPLALVVSGVTAGKLQSDRESNGISCGRDYLCQVERVKNYLSLALSFSLFIKKKERERNSYEKQHWELSADGAPLRLKGPLIKHVHRLPLRSRQHTTMCLTSAGGCRSWCISSGPGIRHSGPLHPPTTLPRIFERE